MPRQQNVHQTPPSTAKLTYHLMHLLIYFALHLGNVGFHLAHKRQHILLHLLGRERQLSDRHPHHRHLLPVLIRRHHIPHTLPHPRNHGSRLRTRHKPLRTQYARHIRLSQLRQTINVANAAIEIQLALPDMLKHLFFPDERGALGARLGCRFRVWSRDDADSYVGLDGVGQS